MLIRDNTKILETKPQFIQAWTDGRGGFSGMRGRGRGGAPPGMDGPRGMGPLDRGGMGPMGGFPGMQNSGERKGESTVAISLPLKNLKQGTYMLQIHVRDAIADVNLFQRVPIVIQ